MIEILPVKRFVFIMYITQIIIFVYIVEQEAEFMKLSEEKKSKYLKKF